MATVAALSSLPQALPKAFIKQLQQAVGKAYVLTAPEEQRVYECDAYLLMQAPPQAVVLPISTQQVADVVKACNQFDIAFTARGAGTGLSGGALALQGGIIISLNRMQRIVAIDEANQTATVEAGVVNGRLNEVLASSNFFFAPDPSSQSASTIGGNIAENAGGIHCLKYGVTTDHVLALEMVTTEGEVIWLGSSNRFNRGLNLTGLLTGSEGTLGIVTQALVALTRRPQAIQVFLAAFPNIQTAANCVSAIMRDGLAPAALELMDAFTVRAVNAAFGVGFPEDSEAVLLIEIDGTKASLAQRGTVLNDLLKSHQALQIKEATTPEDRHNLWQARKKAVASYGRYYPAFYLHDCVIPRSQLAPVLSQILAVCEHHNVAIANVFHAGDGNLHPHILFNPKDDGIHNRVHAAGVAIIDICLAAGGTLSGEHGIGIEKAHLMPKVFNPADLERMAAIKSVFDLSGRCNPGKLFPVRHGCGEVGAHGPFGKALVNTMPQQTWLGRSIAALAERGLWI
ncbi:MAG: FAD-linked oxidase C-terminal domain-containing protein [Vampirovibrionales bacterium]|nr:FAD-linked oxidase C-terminal domain-containing protein [Vampirovibrionales bacterium]